MDPLTVLIADDHPVFRKRLRALLASIPDVDLAGEASSGADAIRLAEQLQPDVILMDLQMPGGGGLAGLALDKPPKGLTCNQWRKGHIRGI